MSSYIQYELWLLGQSVLLGAGISLGYLVVRVIKKFPERRHTVLGMLDILYWLLAGLLIFTKIYETNQGILRSFILLGMAFGAYLVQLFPGPFLEKILCKILEFPVRTVKKSINRLLFCKKRCKILARQLVNQYKNSTGKRFRLKRGRKLGKIREKEQKKE